MKRYALLVGINKYHTLGNLSYARQDAEAFKQTLCERYGFKPHEAQLMTCESGGASMALSAYLEDALDRVAKKTDLDLLVFGFWGHGFHSEDGRMYLCGMETLREKLRKTAVSLGMVRERLVQASAKDTLIVLDCCRNLVDGRSVGGTAFATADAEQLAELARDLKVAPRKEQRVIPTVAVVNSCRVGQRAYEWEERRHGVFTAHLLDAMRYGERSVSRIVSSITEPVAATTNLLYHQEQVPFTIIEGRGDIAIGEESMGQSSFAAGGRAEVKEEYHACPECGFYNRVEQTFRCVECGREYLCRSHYDEHRNMCNRCACVPMKEYRLGEKGPAGGYIFYENQNYEADGWRYLEAAPSDIKTRTDEVFIFGFYRKSSSSKINLMVGTTKGIGTGKANTDALVEAMGEEAYTYYPLCTKRTGAYAARLCAIHEAGGFGDWFLPSKEELNLMYQNLKVQNLGDFNDSFYWSSSEENHRYACIQMFNVGLQLYNHKYDTHCVRPIRAF